MKTSLIASAAALACTLLCGAGAHAADLKFNGFANGSQTVDIVLSSPNKAVKESTSAGGFSVSLNGGPSFTSYCIDLYEFISFGTTYNDYTLKAASAHAFSNPNAATDLGKLYAEKNAVTTSVAQAAFQIAVWEIAYETSGHYNLGDGSATFSGGSAATSGALTLAGTWLNTIATTTNNSFNVFALDSIGNPGHQDQLFAAAVPEPSTYALLAGGLLGIGFVARRRASRSR